MKKLFGIDFGTGGCKSTVIDIHGNILASSFKEYPSIHLHQGWSEQNPEIWIDAFYIHKVLQHILFLMLQFH